ncbi:YfhO family protein [Catenulispora sp. NF23]|uniref:YfhO family protein n=1 Tax=Catenulispora pinistramenti TaxID=2705254 RepID=A0ABS5KKD9_9ACTN|nr:YfhO family protein [Catenulispora pinistramenti]MBS2532243.1 YfhO family protein [Catenulispora pinistramenti]MBS2546356.1 YfhO family protein [Catenulispora pinistramenti]
MEWSAALARRLRSGATSYLAVAFGAAVLLYGTVLAGSRIYPFGSKSILMYDMGNQYSVFHAYYQQVLHGHASLLFTWRSDLGLNFLPLFAYYLASPFSLLVAFFPEQYIPEAMVLIILLKVGTGASAMACYLHRMTPSGSRRLAAGFAVPYAVSAWTVSYSFNIMWLDALYLLPLLMIASESLLRRGRVFPLAALAGAAALINYYMFGIMVPFLACYLAIRYVGGDRVVRRTGAGRFAVKCGAALGVGIAIAGVLLLPTYYGLVNGRTNVLGQDPIPVPLPWSTQAARLFGGTFDWFQGSPNLAAGTAVLVAASLFPFLRRIPRRERLGFVALAALLMAASQNQIVYLLFHDGERPNAFPFRYGFMVAALLVMLGYRSVTELRQTEAATAGRLLFRVTVFWLGALIVVVHFERSLMTPYLAGTAALGLVLGAVGIGLATGLRRVPRRVMARATALLAVIMVVDCGVAAAEESSGMQYPGRGTWNVHPTPDWNTAMKSTAPPSGQFFRSDGLYVNFLNGLERSQNESLRDGNFAQNHFSSLSSGMLHDAEFDLGFTEHIYRVWADHTGSTLLTDALLDFKYLVTTSPGLDRADTQLVHSWPTADVYENTATLPVGFLAPATMPRELNHDDPFTAQEQLFDMPGAFADPCQPVPTVTGATQDVSPTGELMYTKRQGQQKVTVTWHCHATDAQELYVWSKRMPWAGQYPGSGIFNLQVDGGKPVDYPNVYDNGIHDLGTRADTDFTVTLTTKLGLFTVPEHFVRGLDVAQVNAKVAELAQHGLYDVHTTDTSLSGSIDADRAGTVFMSVPAIKGWGDVKVDGKPVSATILASAFLGIPVPAGHHTITMSFSPPGLHMGMGLTAVGLVMLFGLYKRDQRGRERGAPPGGRVRALIQRVDVHRTAPVSGVPSPRFVPPQEDPVEPVPVAIADETEEVQA